MTEIPAFTYNEPLGVKVGWMQTGPGPGPGIEFGQALTELANRYEQSDGVVGKSFMAQRAGSQWQGRAAGAADGAVSRAAAAIAVAGRTGKSGGVGSERYGDSFGQAKRAVHVPEKLAGSIDSADPVGSNSTMGEFADGVGDGLNDAFGSTFGIQSDFRARKQAYDEANRAAVEALKAHEARTRAALTTFQAAALPAQSGAAPNGSPGSSVGSARASGARDGVAGGRVGDGGPGGPGGGAPGRAAAGSGLSGGAPSGGAPSGGDPAGVGSPPGGPSTTAAASAGDDGGWTP
ncbi:MAG: hypothetical protein H0V92_01830, partial [Pseudonocardiales bacterium]|nr:hypothetical protein [Pseudonocardiales bacterium]